MSNNSTSSTSADDNTIKKEITIAGQVFILEGEIEFSLTPKGGTVVDPEEPGTDTKPDKPSDFGTIKQGDKWSTEPGPAKDWIIKNMDNPTTDWKLISPLDQKNVIANIKSEAEAKALREYFETSVFPPIEEGGDIDEPEPTEPGAGAGTPTTSGEGPYKSTGKALSSTQRGPTKRNYASGKPSDNTIEKNVKNIPFKNYQAIVDITVPDANGWEHDDNLSIKLGGKHMDGGWFDNGVSIYEGNSCLGTEKKHPSTQLCVVKGKKYGDLRGKRVQVASTYFTDQNKTEFWIKLPGGQWDKGCEGTDVGGFNAKTDVDEMQLRIDGFKNLKSPPEIHSAVVQEIS